MTPTAITTTKAAIGYFAVTFAAGFVFGAARELVLVPRIGGLAAVAVEVPIMLGVSWFVAGAMVRRYAVAGDAATRLALGGLAFVLLQAFEFALAAAFGTSPAAYAAAFATPKGGLGLAMQMLFALIPLYVGPGGRPS